MVPSAALALLGLWLLTAGPPWCLAQGLQPNKQETLELNATMPDFNVNQDDSYLCTSVALPDSEPLQLIGFQPLSSKEVVHHMLLFGCDAPASQDKVWQCSMQPACAGGDHVMYGWGRGADAMHLPPGTSFSVGPGTGVAHVVLQIHYMGKRPDQDESGVRLSLTRQPQPLAAGMVHFASWFSIPPHQPSHHIDNRCCYNGFEPAEGFAFRVHTHMLGRSVFLDSVAPNGSLAGREMTNDPQLPQGFYPVEPRFRLLPGREIQATCDFDSSERNTATSAGSTHHDEMCNLYLLTSSPLPFFQMCTNSVGRTERFGVGGLPQQGQLHQDQSKLWQPPLPLSQSSNAPSQRHFLGHQVSGVANGLNGSLWVFHRAERLWDGQAYKPDWEHISFEEPIAADTLLQLDRDTGAVRSALGGKTFFMPHMVTVDYATGDLWLADTGLHQAIKMSPDGRILQELGRRLEPGHDNDHFCKPTHVAVARDASIYVADGYCNSRVVHFSPDGKHLKNIELPAGRGSMSVPHKLVIDDCRDSLYVADRESSKVHSFKLSDGSWQGTWDVAAAGKPYGLAKGPYGSLFALCWQTPPQTGPVKAVLLSELPGSMDQVWDLPGVEVPHDLEVVAAPVWSGAGRQRPVALMVTETRMQDSRLLKFILLPDGVSLPAEELALPQRSQQREVDEYASDALEDPELERSQPRPDVSKRWAGDGEPGEAEDVSEEWADREGEGSTDFEAEATAGEDFAAEAMDEEGRPGGDLGSEARNDLAGEAMEEERFGDPADFSADQQKDPQGLTSGDEEAAVEAELEAEMEQEEEAEMEQREEAEWRLEEEQGVQDAAAFGEGQEPYEEGASEAQAELRREEDKAERRPVFEDPGFGDGESSDGRNPDLAEAERLVMDAEMEERDRQEEAQEMLDESRPQETEFAEAQQKSDAEYNELQKIPTMHSDMGEPQVIQQDRMSLGAAVGQMFIIGMPFAIAFASVALYLWRRLGDLKPLPRRLPTSDPSF